MGKNYNKICVHNRQVFNCVDCGGNNICEHKKRRHRCKECRGSSICIHGNQKEFCKQCFGAGICRHGIYRRGCLSCGGSDICEHRTRRVVCRICNPVGWAKCALRHLTTHAVKGGYNSPKATPEEVVEMMRTSVVCVLCNQELDWLKGPHLHHNHETGIVEGFTHGFCNLTEGRILKLSPDARVFFLEKVLRK